MLGLRAGIFTAIDALGNWSRFVGLDRPTEDRDGPDDPTCGSEFGPLSTRSCGTNSRMAFCPRSPVNRKFRTSPRGSGPNNDDHPCRLHLLVRTSSHAAPRRPKSHPQRLIDNCSPPLLALPWNPIARLSRTRRGRRRVLVFGDIGRSAPSSGAATQQIGAGTRPRPRWTWQVPVVLVY